VASTGILSAKGLHTDENQIGSVEDGSLKQADNVIIDREAIIQSRRGLDRVAGTFSDSSTANKLYHYQAVLFAQTSSGKLWKQSGGAWTQVGATTYPQPDSANRTRFAEAQGNLYFTSAAGVYRLEGPSGTPVSAGIPKALDATAGGNPLVAGFLANGAQVAYRVVWKYVDGNGVVYLGAPSGRVVFSNATGSGGLSVNLTIPIPSGITTSHYVQVYRSTSFTPLAGDTSSEPSDEMGLVYETQPASVASALVVTDSTPDSLLGATLYASPSQEGILQSNERPPLARDVALFRGSLFYANTAQRHRQFLTLLGVGGSTGLQLGEQLQVGSFAVTLTATAATQNTSGSFILYSAGSAAQNVAQTAKNIIQAVNQHTSNTTVNAYYVSGTNELPGKMLFEERGVGGSTIALIALSPTIQTVASGTTLAGSNYTAGFMQVTVNLSATHGFTVGSQVNLQPVTSADSHFPAGLKTVTAVTSASFTYVEADTLSGGSFNSTVQYTAKPYQPGNAYNPTLNVSVFSTNEARKNRLYFSKAQQPEAVPTLNYVDVGSAYAAILRIIPLRDSLIILKEDGTYRLVGDGTYNFRVEAFDTTAILLVPESAVALSNKVVGYFNQGVCSLSESNGTQVLSRPIETDLLKVLGSSGSTARTQGFGVAYETDRKYLLALPNAVGDTSLGQVYVYNTMTEAWTRWTRAQTCGVVGSDDLLYLGDTGSSSVSVERKTRSSADYADFLQYVTGVTGAGNLLQLVSVSGLQVGDAVQQGSNLSKITAINVGTNTITVADVLSWLPGQGSALRAISVAVAYAPQVAQDAGAAKQFREVEFFFTGGLPTAFTASFSSEIMPTPLSVALDMANASTPGEAWTYIPPDAQRCNQLFISFTHAVALEQLSLQGFTLDYKNYGRGDGH
jgi:hypothetical protein